MQQIIGRRTGENFSQPAVDQEARLRGVTEKIKTGFTAAFGNGGEVHMSGNVLQAGQIKGGVV